MFRDKFKFSGTLNINLIDSFGNTKINETHKNLVVSSGINYIINRMLSNTTPIMSSMALGIGTSQPILDNTHLQTEIARVEFQTSIPSANSITYIGNFLPGVGTGTICEAGIFNNLQANTGTMLCRTTFPEINKEGGDTLLITWNVSGD